MKLAILLLTVQVLVLSMAKPNSFMWAQTKAIVSDCQDRCKGKPEHKQCLEECNESPCGPASNWDAVCGFKHATCWVSQNKKLCSCKCGGTRDNCFRCKGPVFSTKPKLPLLGKSPGEGGSSGTGEDYTDITPAPWHYITVITARVPVVQALYVGLAGLANQCRKGSDEATCIRSINEARNRLKNIEDDYIRKNVGEWFESYLRSTRSTDYVQEADYYPSWEGEGRSSGTGKDYGSDDVFNALFVGLAALARGCTNAACRREIMAAGINLNASQQQYLRNLIRLH